MATLKLKGGDTREIIVDGKWKDPGVKALADDGKTNVTSTVTVSGSVDTSTPGSYTITYTLPQNLSGDEFNVDPEVVVTRTVNVIEKEGVVDTTFDLGDETRKGKDVSGSKYDQLVDTARAGTTPEASSSAYFSETALDPYEVKNSK